ncbi:MAG: DUF2797 domain-containing protein [Spirochaetales bacterium]|nr:DUF2797 domain-containing protein [Spirochaetales bacterium]
MDSPIRYETDSSEGLLEINPLIGKNIRIAFEGEIHCVVCGKRIKKTFAQGSCYDCFRNAPENSECIIRPELCRAHEGKGRDPEWEQIHHNRPHFVYLALSSAVKVGVTRDDQIPTRWIDQGASEGLVLANCPNRFHAGEMEVFLKDFFTDRTNWQRMLKNQIAPDSLSEVKEKLLPRLPAGFREWITPESDPLVLEYPVVKYPEKVKSLKLDKSPLIEGALAGIKGQYLIFDGGRVMNMRAHSGYRIYLEPLS